MKEKFSIGQQCEEVEREIQQRSQVYPRLVSNHQMRQSVADFHMARMEAVLESLRWLEANRDGIVSKIKEATPT
jgi:hypothetical protein